MIQKIIQLFIGKKKIVAWVSAALIAFVALIMGEPVGELKKAICDAPVMELPKEVIEKVEAIKVNEKIEVKK